MVSYSQRDTIWAPPGKAVDDNGGTYGTIQAAVDAAESQVLVGPGMFNENVTISTADFNLIGSGPGTILNGDDSHAIRVSAENVEVKSMTVQTTGGGGNSAHGIFYDGDGDDGRIADITVGDADSDGIHVDGSNNQVENILIRNSDRDGVDVGSNGNSVTIVNAFAGVEGWAVDCGTEEGQVSMILARASTGAVRATANDTGIVGVVSDATTSDAVSISGNNVQFTGGLLKGSAGDGIVITGTDVSLNGVTTLSTTGTALNDAGATTPRYSNVYTDGSQADNIGGGGFTQSTDTGATGLSDGDSSWADASTEAYTGNLPSPSAGTEVRVIGVDDTNGITVSRNGTETIDGVQEDITLAAEQTVHLEADGTNWRLIEGYLYTAQGTVTLASGTATVDTGVTSTSAAFDVDVGISDPNADANVVAAVDWDDTGGTHEVTFLEDTTNVGNPTVNYVIKRTRA